MKDLAHQLIDQLDDILVPVAVKLLETLIRGENIERALTQAERDLIAQGMRKTLDETLDAPKR